MQNIINSIPLPDQTAIEAARARQDSLVKPPHSLGKLEDISVKLAGITGQLYNPMEKRRVIIFASDNGIVEEGVASAPKSVTLTQTINFTRGINGVGTISRHFHTDLDVIDVGIDADFEHPGVRNCKIARGTKNFSKEPAMSREECLKAMMIGVEAARRAKAEGIQVIGIGEMGIGNTSTSSAVLSVLLSLPAKDTVSRGAGINDEAYLRKVRLIDEAIARYQPDPADPIDVIRCVGGFDIAAMCGAFIGAAAERLPAVVDGFISAVAALCACRLNPLCAEYLFPSHMSRERGYMLAMDAMGLEPMLNLDMRLGEGSGTPIAFEVMAVAESIISQMATFEEAAINDDYLREIRANKRFVGEA